MDPKTSLPRRRFLAGLAAGAAAIPLMRLNTARADQPHLSPTDPQASALHYTEDASKVDASKEASYKKGDKCDNCALYQGDRSAKWGPCAVFPGHDVAAAGWCTSYAPMG